MPEINTNAGNKVITVTALGQFLENLKTFLSTNYLLSSTASTTYAQKNGSTTENFQMKEAKICMQDGTDNDYAQLQFYEDIHGKYLQINSGYASTTVKIPLRDGTLVTQGDLDNAMSTLNASTDGKLQSLGYRNIEGTKLATVPHPCVFTYPAPTTGNSLIVEDASVNGISKIKITNLKRSARGRIFYISASQTGTWNISSLPGGFYMVTDIVAGVSPDPGYTILTYVCAPNRYTVYYNDQDEDSSLCTYNTGAFSTIAVTGGGGGGGGDYEYATDADIDDIFNNTSQTEP